MASSIASHVYLGTGSTRSTRESLEMYIPKQTTIDKIGGIFCHICNSIFGNKKEYDKHYTQHNAEGTDIVYTCVVCKKQFTGYPSFRGHCYLNHVVKNRFPCQHCSKSFCKLAILNGHISAVHDFKCSSCDEKFTSKNDLEIHKNSVHTKVKKCKDEPPYDCHSCGKVIKTIDVCESHIDDHCEIQYPCPICKEVLRNKMEATKHLTKHFNEIVPDNISPSLSTDCSIDILGGILCCHCDQLFKCRTEIDSHFITDHEDKTIIYTCNICEKQYEKYVIFGDHCYEHISKEKFQCDQCNKSFPRPSLLVIHTEAFHTGSHLDKPFACELCGHGFRTRHRLRLHIRIEHEEINVCEYRCSKPGCSKQFERPRELIMHQKEHSGPLDTWCRQCGLQFAALASASRHLDAHRRTQYSCPVCRRAYREKYLAARHVAVHFAGELHVCKTCGKAYGARRRLVHHLKTHSDARSLKCAFCSKTFLKPHELQQHTNVHTGRKPYRCTFCPKTFANYPNWSKHLTRMHGMDKPAIKQLNAERETQVETAAVNATATATVITDAPAPAPAPGPESGIESAGSELSLDLYGLGGEGPRGAGWDAIDTFCDPVSAEVECIANTVNAVIDRIDSLDADLDLAHNVEMSEFNSSKPDLGADNIMLEAVDDASDIKAIVEHIDAMSGEMEANNCVVLTADDVPGLEDAGNEVLQYAEMLPVDNTVFNTIPESHHSMMPAEVSYCQPEYGPDFLNESAGLTCDGLINLDDHMLPHIDPLLTIKAQEKARMYVDNLQNFNFEKVAPITFETQNNWKAPVITKVDNVAPINYETQDDWNPPIITKVFPYEDSDANRMYIY